MFALASGHPAGRRKDGQDEQHQSACAPARPVESRWSAPARSDRHLGAQALKWRSASTGSNDLDAVRPSPRLPIPLPASPVRWESPGGVADGPSRSTEQPHRARLQKRPPARFCRFSSVHRNAATPMAGGALNSRPCASAHRSHRGRRSHRPGRRRMPAARRTERGSIERHLGRLQACSFRGRCLVEAVVAEGRDPPELGLAVPVPGLRREPMPIATERGSR